MVKRLWKLWRSPVYALAKNAVREVARDQALQLAAATSTTLPFCPRCGQRPDGDRRMDEARERVMSQVSGYAIKRSDLDLLLSWHYWRLKND